MISPSYFTMLGDRFRRAASAFRRRDDTPIASEAGLRTFVSTRSAFIAQKTLYGYLRTRIGTRYPEAFAEPTFARSIDIAKLHVFAACLSDLSVHTVARAFQDPRIDDATRRRIATDCFRGGLDDNAERLVDAFSRDDAEAAHAARVALVDWAHVASRPADAFASSPEALVRWAPIAPELKRHDTEIVGNSIRFAWQAVRVEFGARVDAAALVDEALGARG